MNRNDNADYYRKKAAEIFTDEGRVEVDDDAKISASDDPDAGGCYVQAWVWVPDPETDETEADQ